MQLPELEPEETPEYGDEDGQEDEAPPGYTIESPTAEQQVAMSDIRETTGEYVDENEDEYEARQEANDFEMWVISHSTRPVG